MQSSLTVRHLAHNQEIVGASPTSAHNIDNDEMLNNNNTPYKESLKLLINSRGVQQG